MAVTVHDVPLTYDAADEIPIADLVISERLPDGTVLITRGRGRLMPSGDGIDRSEVRWFADPDGAYYRHQLVKGVPR